MRVLDFTALLQGPLATQIFGDLSAEVIMFEKPGGEWMRYWGMLASRSHGESEYELSEDSSEHPRYCAISGRSKPVSIISALPGRPVDRGATSVNETYTIDELMVAYIAHSVQNRSVCSVESVSQLATIAYLLAKRMWAPRATIILSDWQLHRHR